MDLTSNNVNVLYEKACRKLTQNPDHKVYSSKGKYLKECVATRLTLTNPRSRVITIPVRKISKFYLAGELAFYFSGSKYVKDIAYYSKFWNKISDNGRTVNSNYGKKLLYDKIGGHSQFAYAFEQLKKNKDSKKAVMIIYTKENTNRYTKDNPCTMYLQFFIRNDRLDLHAYMRSNDILFGVTYDLPFFTILQEMMLVMLYEEYPDLKLGEYVHHSGSLHVYDYHYKIVEEIGNNNIPLNFMDNTEMPKVTLKTFSEMENFLKAEKAIRKSKSGFTGRIKAISDPFLLRLLEWIIGGTK